MGSISRQFHWRKTFYDEMFYRCLTVMNDNRYDNKIHIYCTRANISQKTVYYYLLSIRCVWDIYPYHFTWNQTACRHRDVDYFQKNTYHMLSQSQLTEAKCVKKNEYILRMCHLCTISGISRKSTITVLNKTLEDFLLFFFSYLSLWFQSEAKFCTAMLHDTKNSV
jgi:hypothetical protein